MDSPFENTSCSLAQIARVAEEFLRARLLPRGHVVWARALEACAKLFNAEAAALFVVDIERRSELVLHAQYPTNLESVGASFQTSICADDRRAEQVLKQSLFCRLWHRDASHRSFFKSDAGKWFSALLVPIKNGNGRVIAMLRLLNRQDPRTHQRAAFLPEDESVGALIATQIAAVLENATTFQSLLGVAHDIQEARSAETVIDEVLTHVMSFFDADHTRLHLWNQKTRQLELARERTRYGLTMTPENAEPADWIVNAIWQEAFDTAPDLTSNRNDVWLNSGPNPDRFLYRCLRETQASLSVVLNVHGQPIGVLHLETMQEYAFNEGTQKLLHEFSQCLSVSCQAVRKQYVPEPIDGAASLPGRLWQAEGHYESLVNNVAVVMWRKDRLKRFTWVNDAFLKATGTTRKEVIGRTDREVFAPELADRFERSDKFALEQGTYEDPDEPYIGTDGTVKYIHVVKKAVVDILGRKVGTQGFFLDVTRDKYRKLFNEVPIAFHELDRDGKIVHVNQFESKLIGDDEAQLKGKSFAELTSSPSDTKRWIEQLIQDGTREGEWVPVNLKKRDLVATDQSSNTETIPVLISSRRVTDQNEYTIGLLCAVRDLTASAEVEKAFQNADPRYLSKIRKLNLPVFCVDENLRVTFFNVAHLEMDELRENETVQGKKGNEIYGTGNTHQGDGSAYDADNLYVLTTGNVINKFEYHRGSLVRVLKFPIREKGKCVGVQGVFWKVEQHDQAIQMLNKALADAFQEYMDIVQSAVEGIFQGDANGVITTANPKMLEFLGLRSEYDLETNYKCGIDRFAVASECEEYFTQLKAAPAGSVVTFEYQLIHRGQNSTIWVSETIRTPQKDGEPYVGIVEDVSARKESEEKLKDSLHDKEETLLMLAHQLRSPAWQAYEKANMLVLKEDKDGLLVQGTAQGLLPALAAIRGLTRKTRGVAYSIDTMARLIGQETLKIPKQREIIPRTLLKYAIEAARDQRLLRSHPQEFSRIRGRPADVPTFVATPSDLHDFSLSTPQRFVGNTDLIEQCIGNLVDNAFKYSIPDSEIQIAFKIRGRSAHLAVRNRPLPGLEIDAETAKLCRIKGWRSQQVTLLDADGAGLGLWFVDSIMIPHGGRLEITPTTDGWNTFSLIFPLTHSTNSMN